MKIERIFFMKTMRYLLIVAMVSVASMVFATAQSLAQQPKAEMHSTSGMVYSGSTLPSAAEKGAVLTGSQLGTYSPADAEPSRAHKAKKVDSDDDGWEDEDDPDGPADPFPVGDAALPLALLACAYAIYKVRRRIRA